MILLKRHFDYKDTAAIGKWFINGCQTQQMGRRTKKGRLANVERVCDKFVVPYDVREAFYRAIVKHDFTERAERYIAHKEMEVRCLAVRTVGVNAIRELYDTYTRDPINGMEGIFNLLVNPSVPTDLLKRCAEEYPHTKKNVLAHPNAPMEMLMTADAVYAGYVLDNPSCTPELIARVFAQGKYAVITIRARNAPSEMLARIYKESVGNDDTAHIAHYVLAHPNCPADILRDAYNGGNLHEEAAEYLLQNPNLSAEWIADVYKNLCTPNILSKAVGNPNCPTELFEHAVFLSGNRYIGASLAASPTCPTHVLKKLGTLYGSGRWTKQRILLNPKCTMAALRYMLGKTGDNWFKSQINQAIAYREREVEWK